MTDPSDLCSACAGAAMQNETFVTCDDGCEHGGCPWSALEKAEARVKTERLQWEGRFETLATERDTALNREVALVEAATELANAVADYRYTHKHPEAPPAKKGSTLDIMWRA